VRAEGGVACGLVSYTVARRLLERALFGTSNSVFADGHSKIAISTSMPPAAADDDLPPEEDDLEAPKTTVPPIKGLGKHKGADEAEEPLLSGSAGGKQAASDEPESGRKTPRDKFRELSTSTPREKPGAPSTDPGSAADPTAAALKRAGVDSEILQKSGRDLLNEMMAEAAPITKLPENKRMEAYIESLAKQAEGTQAAEAVGILKPCLVMTIRIFMACGPCMSCFWKWGNILYAWLPKNVTMMIFGATLCYFGGTFTASIAAYEAFRRMGFDRAQGDLDHIMTQIEKVKDANVLDDTKDDDGDGVADVQQVTPSELVRRKLVLIMKTIDEPDRINTAAASIWAASISVLATLAIEFAATTAMALGVRSAQCNSRNARPSARTPAQC